MVQQGLLPLRVMGVTVCQGPANTGVSAWGLLSKSDFKPLTSPHVTVALGLVTDSGVLAVSLNERGTVCSGGV
jgi:hypothetical protein